MEAGVLLGVVVLLVVALLVAFRIGARGVARSEQTTTPRAANDRGMGRPSPAGQRRLMRIRGFIPNEGMPRDDGGDAA